MHTTYAKAGLPELVHTLRPGVSVLPGENYTSGTAGKAHVELWPLSPEILFDIQIAYREPVWMMPVAVFAGEREVAAYFPARCRHGRYAGNSAVRMVFVV